MTDREERQHVIEVLEHMLEWMKAANTVLSKPERIKALDYAINSIKTDLRYDLLYEETSGQADKPTAKNDVPDINVGKIDYVSRKEVIEQCQEWRNHEFVTMTNPYYYLEKRLNNLISVTPLSGGLEKNSKKLEKDFGESDCISREQAKVAIRDKFKDLPSRVEINTILNELPSVTSQEPRKGHWIPIYQGDEIIDYRCSECEFGNTFGRGTFGMDFCPRCGADMREVVEE